MKEHRSNYSLCRPYGSIYIINRGTNYEYKKGIYHFKYGMISIYAETKFYCFTFIFLGRIYTLNVSEIKNPISDRQLIVRAGKFAREVISTLGITN